MNLRQVLGSWAAPLLIHNHNQQTAMDRAAAAQAQGLDPNVFGVPLPGSTVTTTTNNTGGGLLKGALLSAALLAGGAAGGLGLSGALSAPKVPTPPPSVSQVAPRDKHYQAIYERQQPDGTWKEIKRENLK